MKPERAIRILREVGCSPKVIKHCQAVARKAIWIAKRIRTRGYEVDLELVETGALLHDIGRSRTHGIRHGIIGAEILRRGGLGEFARFAENHLGAGIPSVEARELGLPAKDFMPKTLEEKIVVYADKLIKGQHGTSFKEATEWFKVKLGPNHPALQRFENLHIEIQRLLGKA